MSFDLKAYFERRDFLKNRMENILNSAKTENRVMTPEEKTEFDNAFKEINGIDDTTARLEMMEGIVPLTQTAGDALTPEDKDIKNFASFIRAKVSGVENTATYLEGGESGAIIPKTIAKKIIDKAIQLSNIASRATVYHTKGTLTIPVVDNSSDDIAVGYAEDLKPVDSHAPKFKTIDLKGFLFRALCLIPKGYINNTDVKLVDFVVNRMAKAIAAWEEDKFINGDDKILGICGSYDAENMKIELGPASEVTADELIEIKRRVPQLYRQNGRWLLNPETFTAIKKLKDNDGRYIFNEEENTLLGKPVDESDCVATLGAGNKAIIFGDYSGLAIKRTEEVEIQVLTEKYAELHAVGILGFGEVDSQIENLQTFAVGVCA